MRARALYVLMHAVDALQSLAEVHFLGEIAGGTGFAAGVSCKWAFEVSLINAHRHTATHAAPAIAFAFAVW